MIEIVADDRERNGGVVECLRGHKAVFLTVERLPLGNYRIDEFLLIERKTLPDLVTSIKDGRLFGQAHRLIGSPLRKALALEGTVGLAGSGMRREAIQGALIGLTLYLGLPLLRSRDPAETAQLMLFAARQGRLVATSTAPRPGRRPRGKPRIQSRVLQGLLGIGPQRARHLLETFGSLEEIIQADAEALASVHGIGGHRRGNPLAVEEASPVYGNSDETTPLWEI